MSNDANSGDNKDITVVRGVPVDTTAQPKRSWAMFLYVIVAAIVASALIGIIAILFGGTGFIGKALLTILIVAFHVLGALGLLFNIPSHKRPSQLVCVSFAIIFGSLLTSTLGLWDVISSTMTGNLYQVFFFGFLASALAQVLLLTAIQDMKTRYATFATIGIDVLLLVSLLPWIFADENFTLPDLYYRIIASLAILLGTSTLVTAVMHIIYRAAHPAPTIAGSASRPISGSTLAMWILLGILCFYILPFVVRFMFFNF